MKRWERLPLATTIECGLLFETAVPVRFAFLHNTEKAPYFGSRYQQDIEPAGVYVLHVCEVLELPRGWVSGMCRLQSPLVLLFDTGDKNAPLYRETSWKAALHKAYRRRGKGLAAAILADGFDGIVTVEQVPENRSRDGTRELVVLDRRALTFD